MSLSRDEKSGSWLYVSLTRTSRRQKLTGMIGIAFKKALSFFLDLYRCDSRSWALNCCEVSMCFWESIKLGSGSADDKGRKRKSGWER